MNCYVTGLVLRLKHKGRLLDGIGGPAVYAAIGCSLAGLSPKMYARISYDVSQSEMIRLRSLGVDMELCETSGNSSLILAVESLRPDCSVDVSSNPLLWMPSYNLPCVISDVIVASNGDPHWLMNVLNMSKPGFLAIDLHHSWFRARASSLRYCISCAQLITCTIHEYKLLLSTLGHEISRANALWIIKDGVRGVTVTSVDESVRLPPPTLISSNIVNDTGAGDFLLGLIVGYLFRRESSVNPFAVSTLCDAYIQSLQLLPILFSSPSPSTFYRGLMAF